MLVNPGNETIRPRQQRSDAGVKGLQSELFFQLGKVEWKRSILENCVGDNVFDSQILVVSLCELVVGFEMCVLLSCRARLRTMRAGSVVEQAAQFSKLLVGLNVVSCLFDAIKLIDERWFFDHAEADDHS